MWDRLMQAGERGGVNQEDRWKRVIDGLQVRKASWMMGSGEREVAK